MYDDVHRRSAYRGLIGAGGAWLDAECEMMSAGSFMTPRWNLVDEVGTLDEALEAFVDGFLSK
ncbi:UNVERIFIED_ORG: hypothetical protein BTE55_21825 [Rhizobium sophorae]